MKDFNENINKKYLHSEITAKILQGFYHIISKFGYGFGIEAFRKALTIELEFLGLKCEADELVELNYRDKKIGEFKIDILVEEKVNVMIISDDRNLRKSEIKLSNQLKNSKIEVGLLLKGQIDGEHKRLFFSNDNKQKI